MAWYHGGHARRLQAEVVNYADDFVILCHEGSEVPVAFRLPTGRSYAAFGC